MEEIVCFIVAALTVGILLGRYAREDKNIYLIIYKLNQMAKSQAEGAQDLRDFKVQLAKANDEIQTKIQALIDAAANAPVSDELQAAIDELKPAVQALDDIVPDVPNP